jgi:acyl-CoA reductase-like NAD-dependent aldehyde dehydrogenase
MYINGEWVSAKSGTTFEVFNPANGETIGQVPDGGREDAVLAIQAAGAKPSKPGPSPPPTNGPAIYMMPTGS